MAREPALLLDVAHLLLRSSLVSPSGVDRVDLAYARYAAEAWPAAFSGIHFLLGSPRLLPAASIAHDINAHRHDGGTEPPTDDAFARLMVWLDRSARENATLGLRRIMATPSPTPNRVRQLWNILRLALGPLPLRHLPAEAIYLSATQYAYWQFNLSKWLGRHPRLKPVFFVHDLLPLDHPEFFPRDHHTYFERYITTIMNNAAGCIVTSEIVAARLQQEFGNRNCAKPPVHVAPLPPPECFETASKEESQPHGTPYFVICGTIEPRKNHLLVLNVWKELVREGGDVPRLIIVGKRGWENKQVLNLLDHDQTLAGHVIEVSGLSTVALRRLLLRANAALFPSFEEGYGLPLVEALTLSVPVLASDIPVTREVGQGRALYLDPVDHRAWRETIVALSSRESPQWHAAKAEAERYQAPTWPEYFAALSLFLKSL